MSRTDPIPDLQDLERYFRNRVPGDPDRWQPVWASWAEQAEDRRAYCVGDPREWPAEVQTITRALRKGMTAERIVKPSGAVRHRQEHIGSTQLAEHQLARAVALAEHAESRPDTVEFRERWLTEGVRVTDDEVRAWSAANAGATLVRWVPEFMTGELAGGPEDGPSPEMPAAWPDFQAKAVGPRPDELMLAAQVGASLKALSSRLVREYEWSPGLAVTFVLTGAVPDAPILRAEARVCTRGFATTASDLITLRVHPDVPAGEVEAAYRATQAQHWGRARLISGRTAEAVYRSTTVSGGAKAQNAAMQEPYSDSGNFRRTVERAKRKLIGATPQLTRADLRGMAKAIMVRGSKETDEGRVILRDAGEAEAAVKDERPEEPWAKPPPRE